MRTIYFKTRKTNDLYKLKVKQKSINKLKRKNKYFSPWWGLNPGPLANGTSALCSGPKGVHIYYTVFFQC